MVLYVAFSFYEDLLCVTSFYILNVKSIYDDASLFFTVSLLYDSHLGESALTNYVNRMLYLHTRHTGFIQRNVYLGLVSPQPSIQTNHQHSSSISPIDIIDYPVQLLPVPIKAQAQSPFHPLVRLADRYNQPPNPDVPPSLLY